MSKSFKLILVVLLIISVLAVLLAFFTSKKSKNTEMINSKNMSAPMKPQNEVLVYFQAPTGDIVARHDTVEDVTIKSTDGSKKISAIQLTFLSEGAIKITAIDIVRPDGGKITVLQNKINANSATIAAAILDKAINLPTEIQVKIHAPGISTGTGKITLDQQSSRVVGPVPGNSYILNQTDEPNFIFK